MYIFRLIKQINPRRGARYLYTIVDRNGREISRSEDNKLFVAAIVGKHEKGGGLGSVLSVSKYTQTPANLGKSMTAGGRADVFGLALAETMRRNDGTRRPVTRSAENFDRITIDHVSVDWNELPAEFHRGPNFITPLPLVARDDSDWIDELPSNLGRDRPADQDAATKEFNERFGVRASYDIEIRDAEPGEDIATPDPALSAGDGSSARDFADMAIKSELKRRLKGGGTAAEDFLRDLDQRAGNNPMPHDPATVERVDELLRSLTNDMFLGFLWASFLSAETEGGTGKVQDVREISRARRKLVLAVDDLARKTGDAFVAEVYGSETPDPASPPADQDDADDEATSDRMFPGRKFGPDLGNRRG